MAGGPDTHARRLVIGPPGEVPPANEAARGWWRRARAGEPVRFFECRIYGEPVAALVLHDIEAEHGRALVAYHVYEPSHRRHGLGTAALRAVQETIRREGLISELVVITSAENTASRRLAQRCGFTYRGAPREDANGMLFIWRAS